MITTVYKSTELIAFENQWLTLDWSLLTTNQKQSHIIEHYRLLIASKKEEEQSKIDGEAEAEANRLARRQQAITYLTNRGFACDNSLADWQKLYNHPKVFGENWNAQALYQFGLGKDLDYFLQVAYSFWVEYVKG